MNKTKETLYQCSLDWDAFYKTTAYTDLVDELVTWRAEIDAQLIAELTTRFGRSSDTSARLLAGNRQTLDRVLDLIAIRADELRREYAASDESDAE